MSFVYKNIKIIVYINVTLCTIILKWEKRVVAFSYVGILYLKNMTYLERHEMSLMRYFNLFNVKKIFLELSETL